MVLLDSFSGTVKVPQPVIGPCSLARGVLVTPVHLSPHHSYHLSRPRPPQCLPLVPNISHVALCQGGILKGAF